MARWITKEQNLEVSRWAEHLKNRTGCYVQKTEQRNNRYWVAMDIIKSKVWVLMSIMLTKSALI